MTTGSFEPIADWWNASVGETGDQFHRHLARPALHRVLGDVAGLAVLDLGCGNGSSTRPLARLGARMTGIDISATLIRHATGYERDAPLAVTYAVGDAARLPFADGAFDRVSANMVMMDLGDGAGAIRELGRVLKPGGRVAMSLFHPCFQVLDGSSWLIESGDQEDQISRKVWRYREAFGTLGKAKLDQPEPHMNYHRPLGWYVEQLVRAGLLVDALEEPLAEEGLALTSPSFYQRQAVIPALIVLGAVKAA